MRIMVDMSATLLHHGHTRLLKYAASEGTVVVGLTTDKEIRLHKGYQPEMTFTQRKEILLSIKYVTEVVPAPWLITNAFLDRHRIDFLIHGDDNSNNVDKSRIKLRPRTRGVSSTAIRQNVLRSVSQIIENRGGLDE